MLEYKGYSGRAEFDEEAGILHGEVLGLRDVVTFQGRSVEELEEAFRDSVDDYLEFCEERGEEPDRPFSGRLVLRMEPEVHRSAYVRARREGKSLNQWIVERLDAEPPVHDAGVGASRGKIYVPTRREEVAVERVPVGEEVAARGIDEDEGSVQVTEQEVVVEGRPVVEEEGVVVHGDAVEETEREEAR